MQSRDDIAENVAQVRKLVTSDVPNVHARIGDSGQLPLHIALQIGDADLVQKLLDAGADVNLAVNGKNAVVFAVESGNQEVLDAVLMAVPRPDLELKLNDKNQTPLHVVAQYAELANGKLIATLIDAGADVNAIDVLGKTPLHYAAESKNRIIVDVLLDGGADISIVDKAGETPLRHDASSPLLHAGPRMKSPATIDFEIVAKAFLSDHPPQHVVNALGELEVDIDGQTYNLTKILEHSPDLEHLDLDNVSQEAAEFASRYMQNLTTFKFINDPSVSDADRKLMTIYDVYLMTEEPRSDYQPAKGEMFIWKEDEKLICKVYGDENEHEILLNRLPDNFPHEFDDINQIATFIPDMLAVLSAVDGKGLSETEARAIKYYTMMENSGVAYEKINRFLRLHGKINDLDSPNTASLQSMMLTLTYLSQAIKKLKDFNVEQREQLYRGENYDTSQMAGRVVDTRSSRTVVEAPGFISTTTNRAITDELFSHKLDDKKNVRIIYQQDVNTEGVAIGQWSEKPGEGEKLFPHGLQTTYKKTPYADNLLIASTVRSIDERYSHNYDRDLLGLRSLVIRDLQIYRSQPNVDLSLARLMEDFAKQACKYEAAEMTKTNILCNQFLARAAQVIRAPENEVVIDKFIRNVTDMQFLTQLNTKEYAIPSHKKILKAAKYAYDLHLSVKYDPEYTELYKDDVKFDFSLKTKNERNEDVVTEHTIERPNHGLAHAMRKLSYAPVVINELMVHAKDTEFKDYLRVMNDSTIRLIQYALLFSVSGRKSDAGSKQSIKHYREFREISKSNFLKYMKMKRLYLENPISDKDKQNNAFIDMLADQVKNMGDKHVLNVLKEVAASKKVTPEKRAAAREQEFIFHIIKWSHNLDMMRCVDAGDFKDIIKGTAKLTSYLLDDTFESRAMPTLLTMAQQCIHATGDRSMTAYENGVLSNSSEPYEPETFLAASTDPEMCLSLCFSNAPVLMEVYEGKQNVDTMPKGFSLTELQSALLNENGDKADDLLDNHELSNEEASEFIRLLCDYQFDDAEAEIGERINAILDDEKIAIDQGDLIAAMVIAVSSDNLDLANRLMKRNADVNYANDDGEMPLHLAAALGRVDIAKLIIPHTTNINDSDKKDYTPLIVAVANQQWEIASMILDAPNIDLTTLQGSFALYAAIANSKTDIANQILDKSVKFDYYTDESGNNVMHLAVSNKMDDIAAKLVQRMPDINGRNENGVTALQCACENRSWNVVKALLARNDIDVSGVNVAGYTTLHYAVLSGREDLVSLMLARGADPNFKNNNGDAALGVFLRNAMYQGMNIKMLDILLDGGAKYQMKPYTSLLEYAYMKTEDELFNYFIDKAKQGHDVGVNALKKPFYTTLLHDVCRDGDLAAASKLIKAGADLNLVDFEGRTPLFYAATHDSVELVRTLSRQMDSVDISHFDSYGNSLLMHAASCKSWGIVDMLLRDGRIDVNHNNNDGDTLLQMAARNSRWGVVISMLPRINMDIHKETLIDVLHMAAKEGQLEVLKELEHMGVSLNDMIPAGHTETTVMHIAAENGRADVVDYLLSQHYDIVPELSNGMTPLHLAADYGMDKVIDVFLAHGADINDRTKSDEFQVTPLLMAAENGHWKVVEKLLNVKNIDIGSHNNQNDNLLHFAARSGKLDIVSKILAINAERTPHPINLASENHANKTPLALAQERGHREVVSELDKFMIAQVKLGLAKSTEMGQTMFGSAGKPHHQPEKQAEQKQETGKKI